MSASLEEKLNEFSCQRCNLCCRQPGYVYLGEEEAERIAAFLQINVYQFTAEYCEVLERRHLVLKKHADESCVFLNAQGCQVHAVKPQQCRDFPVRWRTPRSLEYCEGLKKLAVLVLAVSLLLFPGRAFSAEPSSKEQQLIRVYDDFGREVSIEKEEWRKQILPELFARDWENAGLLYEDIVLALRDGFNKEALPAARQYFRIETDAARKYLLYSLVLVKNRKFKEAEGLLREYIEQKGETPAALTLLARVRKDRNRPEEGEALLKQALALDPNFADALEAWVSLRHEKEGKEGALRALGELAALPGNWRARLWLARDALENKNPERAAELYREVLAIAADETDALVMISGDLGEYGHARLALDLVAPLYQFEKHGPYPGFNLLGAELALENIRGAEKYMGLLHASEDPQVLRQLQEYSAQVEALRAELLRAIPADELRVSLVDLQDPLWYFGLENPAWLLLERERREPVIAFLSLAHISARQETDELSAGRENLWGRYTRSLPLYWAEALQAKTDLKVKAFIPVAEGVGPAVMNRPWSKEDIRAAVGPERQSGFLITGEIDDAHAKIRITIWDMEKEEMVHEISRELRGSITVALRDVEANIIVFLKEQKIVQNTLPFFTETLPQAELEKYLRALGESLMMSIAHNGLIGKEQLFGEREMLADLRDWALSSRQWEIPAYLFIGALNKSKNYGSQVYREFERDAFTLLATHERKDRVIYRLSPLLFKLYDQIPAFFQRRDELLLDAQGSYKTWLENL